MTNKTDLHHKIIVFICSVVFR